MVADLEQAEFRWDDVRVVLALAREGNLRGAASRLGVSASTVSRRVEAFEEALGAHLFDRTGDGLLPTAALEELLPHAEAFEHAASGLTRTVAGFEREPEGVVRISALPGYAEHFLPEILLELREKLPRIRIELDASIGYVDLTRHEADIALRSMRPERGDLVAVRLGEAEDRIFGSPRTVERLGTLRSLADADWVVWDRDLAHFSSTRWVTSQVPEERIVLRTSHAGVQLAAVAAGLGLFLQPDIYAQRPELAEVKLTPALRRSLPPMNRHALWLVGHRALREVPRVAAVWDHLVARSETMLRAEGAPRR